ncbi:MULTISPECIES: hypothetical protein [unclassified Streptomyces]|uniref:hypothetical protein n=1 Tax=unclassified Streptomyces TaxID=2593676 RepID=UPI00136F9B5F|nr:MULTISPECIES: hypothetical protein [unclassified Streptomyces]NEA03690.1 hypothetical protein [Streptomyces sp. SID10116]MYY79704.1 hypothetical protein [Streptomyces sp. SID335]MYZ12822.1 hypothetical protein [Streptomyces sp. SID337]NDZ91126.1 hypothetical protein [Streptomyces sp. SID10115]NEB43523.1 hypothetical protein [Streptomyces sp. SID339]
MTAAIPADAFEHGDERRYRRGCRCKKCRAGANSANLRRRYLRQTGRSTLRSPNAAADHVLKLRTAGLDDKTIKAQAEVCCDVLYRIMRRAGDIHIDTERRILNVPIPAPSGGPTRSRAYVDGLGTRRRLQALVAAGWYPAELARRLDKDRENLGQLLNGKRGDRVALYQAEEVRALYAELHGQKPENQGLSGYYVQRARQMAAARGWATPDYWDDDDFDNPDFQPAIDDLAVKRDDLAAVRRAEIEHLEQFNLSEHEIANRLGMAYTTVRNIVLEIRTGQRRVRPREGAAA